jgi:hypothetical protein
MIDNSQSILNSEWRSKSPALSSRLPHNLKLLAPQHCLLTAQRVGAKKPLSLKQLKETLFDIINQK